MNPHHKLKMLIISLQPFTKAEYNWFAFWIMTENTKYTDTHPTTITIEYIFKTPESFEKAPPSEPAQRAPQSRTNNRRKTKP